MIQGTHYMVLILIVINAFLNCYLPRDGVRVSRLRDLLLYSNPQPPLASGKRIEEIIDLFDIIFVCIEELHIKAAE